jgi:hypothetical protein
MLFSPQNDNDDPVALLSPTTRFCNPISAMLMSQMAKIGGHQGEFVVGAIFKYIVRPEELDDSNNALRQNRLQKALIDDEVCNNLRRARRNGRDPNRPVNRVVVSQAHYCLSSKNRADLVTAHSTMLKLFASGSPPLKTQLGRFKQLLLDNRYIQQDSPLYDALRDVRQGVMKNVGNREGYVPFDMDENEKKLMSFVTSKQLFCTRDKIHDKENLIVSIESSPAPDGVAFLDCYGTTTLFDHFSSKKRAKGNTNHQNINNLRNYLQTNKKLVQENYKIYTWPDDDNKVQEQSQRRTPRPHTVSTNIFSVFKIVDKNID